MGGFKRVLQFKDLWDLMPEDRGENIIIRLEEEWHKELDKYPDQ